MFDWLSNNILIYKFNNFSAFPEIVHLISTRFNGFSAGSFSSLNLGLGLEDESIVHNNRKLFAETIGIPISKWVFAYLKHSNNVSLVRNGNYKTNKYNFIENTDGLITNQSDYFLTILTADCAPLLFYDTKQNVIGIAHAGWRGTVQSIACEIIKQMKANFGCTEKNILVGIGPAILSCCYTIEQNTLNLFQRKFDNYAEYIFTRNHKIYLNLHKANYLQLINYGIPKQNIEIADICTSCNNDLFFSHRKQSGNAGRFLTGIMINKKQKACTCKSK